MIWLLRHGEAHDAAPGQTDAERELTEKGRRQSAAAGAALAALGVAVETCLASPRVRARDTAILACEALGVEVEIEPALSGGDIDPERLAAGRGEHVLLVGHEPDLSQAVLDLTGARVEMRKGGLAAIDGRRLAVLLRPRELRAIVS